MCDVHHYSGCRHCLRSPYKVVRSVCYVGLCPLHALSLQRLHDWRGSLLTVTKLGGSTCKIFPRACRFCPGRGVSTRPKPTPLYVTPMCVSSRRAGRAIAFPFEQLHHVAAADQHRAPIHLIYLPRLLPRLLNNSLSPFFFRKP